MLVLGSEVRTVMETHVVEMAAINELASRAPAAGG